ncbi:helix-turn-helix domain-containing protein [Bifidobacterium avesanii]|uniref:Helix-turn-helix domain-containing protein n=1 Tax=Bifidobacterium avesanii TaxID=1798157 RepID=A0A7K3TH80_9BIFI|nr:helix-turn-helix transcriptional regulator [Bifidobacterium avesanii]KAB8294531.1 the helix-turn-helix motif [Bifidobacterium avesanii]NEG78044.1 helix-turn-helix domain-containing protein [Bifidobacterium avesanii]
MTLKELREAKGWSQAKLAEASGVPRPVIADYERGAKDWRNMPLERAIALANALGCDDLRLIGE